MAPENLEPWSDPDVGQWITNFMPWVKMTNLIRSTLKNDAQKFPHQIRAASSLIILLCRQNVWPGTIDQLDEVVSLARRQMVLVKSFFTAEARRKPGLSTSTHFKNLMRSIDQEIRILESRMTEPKPKLRQEPPCTWGNFWDQ